MKIGGKHKRLYDKLTPLQKGVCLNVLEGSNYAKAYFDAGGLAKSEDSAKSIVSRMVSTDVNVMAFMEAMEGEAISSAIMTRRQALERLSHIAGTSITDLIEFSTIELTDADGKTKRQSIWAMKDDKNITPEAMAAIAELSAGQDGLKFKMHSSVAAIKELSNMLGWNTPKKVELTGKDGGAVQVEDMSEREIARRVAFILTKGDRQGAQEEKQ